MELYFMFRLYRILLNSWFYLDRFLFFYTIQQIKFRLSEDTPQAHVWSLIMLALNKSYWSALGTFYMRKRACSLGMTKYFCNFFVISYYRNDLSFLWVGLERVQLFVCRRTLWMKNKKDHTVRTISKSNIKIVDRGEIDTCNTQIHDRSLFLLGTGTSVNSGGAKLVLWAQTSPLGEMMLSHARAFHLWVKCQPSHITGWIESDYDSLVISRWINYR